MKKLRAVCTIAGLTLALTVSAFAGQISSTGVVAPPPPPPPPPSGTSTSTSSITSTVILTILNLIS